MVGDGALALPLERGDQRRECGGILGAQVDAHRVGERQVGQDRRPRDAREFELVQHDGHAALGQVGHGLQHLRFCRQVRREEDDEGICLGRVEDALEQLFAGGPNIGREPGAHELERSAQVAARKRIAVVAFGGAKAQLVADRRVGAIEHRLAYEVNVGHCLRARFHVF